MKRERDQEADLRIKIDADITETIEMERETNIDKTHQIEMARVSQQLHQRMTKTSTNLTRKRLSR